MCVCVYVCVCRRVYVWACVCLRALLFSSSSSSSSFSSINQSIQSINQSIRTLRSVEGLCYSVDFRVDCLVSQRVGALSVSMNCAPAALVPAWRLLLRALLDFCVLDPPTQEELEQVSE
eukprot:GHVU01086937.1.p2 GENE.GHVU01086937.1~~GHVU01086937.1.p2  ORF type:complete len:119 (+),score=22.19 GHVU01086937.1:221-577(+)